MMYRFHGLNSIRFPDGRIRDPWGMGEQEEEEAIILLEREALRLTETARSICEIRALKNRKDA